MHPAGIEPTSTVPKTGTLSVELRVHLLIIQLFFIFTKRTTVLLLCNMRHDKIKAFELRKDGHSYREIQRLLGMSRSTLCEWFRYEKWSKHITKSNNVIHVKLSTERIKKLNDGRSMMLQRKYKDMEDSAEIEFVLYKDNPLFIAGLMLYAGEGDRLSKGVIRIANTDFFVHKIFIRFIIKFMSTPMDNIRFSVLLYPDLNIEDCKIKWSEELNIPLAHFHKPQVIQGRSKHRRLHFGVGSTIISSTFLKRKLLRWIELAKDNLSIG